MTTGDALLRQIRAVRSLVARYRRHRELTDDLEQSGHLGYVRATRDPRYDPDLVAIETWAYRGARHAIHVAYNAECRHRGRVRRARKRARGLRAYHGLDWLDRLAVRDAVSGLEDDEANLIVAWFWLGVPPKEYARVRGIGEGRAYGIRDRAFGRLRDALQD